MVTKQLFSVGVINTWGTYTTDVREANLRSCVCLVIITSNDDIQQSTVITNQSPAD